MFTKKISTLALTATLAFTFSACSAENTDAVSNTTNSVKDAASSAISQTAFTVVNLNTASVDALNGVPGLSPRMKEMVLEGRPFENATALDAFLGSKGIPDAARKGLYKFAFIPFDINATPEAEFLLIPGLSEKMAHEFEEYRPYTSIDQFNREIGKYVDDKELARLRQYITIP